VGLKRQFVIDELGRLTCCASAGQAFPLATRPDIRPRSGTPLSVPDLNQRLLAGAITYVEILVRDDLRVSTSPLKMTLPSIVPPPVTGPSSYARADTTADRDGDHGSHDDSIYGFITAAPVLEGKT